MSSDDHALFSSGPACGAASSSRCLRCVFLVRRAHRSPRDRGASNRQAGKQTTALFPVSRRDFLRFGHFHLLISRSYNHTIHPSISNNRPAINDHREQSYWGRTQSAPRLRRTASTDAPCNKGVMCGWRQVMVGVQSPSSTTMANHPIQQPNTPFVRYMEFYPAPASTAPCTALPSTKSSTPTNSLPCPG
jgi:hypothetical protein